MRLARAIVAHLLAGRLLRRALGRFLLVRRTYSRLQHLRQRSAPDFHRARLNVRGISLFDRVDVAARIAEIRRDAVTFGVQLPETVVERLRQHADTSPCQAGGGDERFLAEEVQNGRLRGGRIVLRAAVGDAQHNDVVDGIARDPVLLEIVRDYLGYWPNKIVPYLAWTFASDLPSDQIRLHDPVTEYHYDLSGFNFVQAFFYLTDVDDRSGAHVMIKGSHVNKTLSMVLTVGGWTDGAIYGYYGRENEIAISGAKGLGFIQDPSCFHKATPPTTANRLVLFIRYS